MGLYHDILERAWALVAEGTDYIYWPSLLSFVDLLLNPKIASCMDTVDAPPLDRFGRQARTPVRESESISVHDAADAPVSPVPSSFSVAVPRRASGCCVLWVAYTLV